jgi:Lar family restriction alleviation protein
MEKIKNCPFCGSKHLEIARTNINACWVECDKCGAQTKSDPTRKGAIKNWNRRATVTTTQTRIVYDQDFISRQRQAA